MITGPDIVGEALTWEGTPWRHQGRLKGVGVDCVGLLLCVGKELKLISESIEFRGYARMPLRDYMKKVCEEHLVSIPRSDAQPGDILLIGFDVWPGHMGILGFDNRIIHAHEPNGKVVHHIMSERWWSKVVGVFRYPGVAT